MVSQELLEGCMSSNLRGRTIHSWVLRGATIMCEILEGIANVFIISLRDVTNSIESRFTAEDLAANTPSE